MKSENVTGLTERLLADVSYMGIPHVKNDLLIEAATTLETLTQEVERLRGALIEAGREAGAFLADNVTNDFLMYVPGEVKGVLAKKNAENARLREALEGIAARNFGFDTPSGIARKALGGGDEQ